MAVQRTPARTRDFERHTFGPFTRRAVLGVTRALFTDPDRPEPPGLSDRFEWTVEQADDLVSHGSPQLRVALRVAITLLELLPVLVVGRLCLASSLSAEQGARFLARIERRSFTQLALLVIAWKTLLTIVYFEHPDAEAELGHDGVHARFLRAKEAP